MPKIFPLPCQTGTTDSPFPQKFSELIRIPSDNIFGITQEHQLFSRIINHLFMKKETEFEPALRQVISQTFIDTPAPRKTRYRIIHPDLNTLKNAEDNLSIVLCVSERKTRLELATPTLARLCSTTELLPHLATRIRFELTISAVTGRHVRPLHHRAASYLISISITPCFVNNLSASYRH